MSTDPIRLKETNKHKTPTDTLFGEENRMERKTKGLIVDAIGFAEPKSDYFSRFGIETEPMEDIPAQLLAFLQEGNFTFAILHNITISDEPEILRCLQAGIDIIYQPTMGNVDELLAMYARIDAQGARRASRLTSPADLFSMICKPLEDER